MTGDYYDPDNDHDLTGEDYAGNVGKGQLLDDEASAAASRRPQRSNASRGRPPTVDPSDFEAEVRAYKAAQEAVRRVFLTSVQEHQKDPDNLDEAMRDVDTPAWLDSIKTEAAAGQNSYREGRFRVRRRSPCGKTCRRFEVRFQAKTRQARECREAQG